MDSVNLKKITEDAIVKVLADLDPHSVYIPREELEEANEPLEGGFFGIGIQFNVLRDTLTAVSYTHLHEIGATAFALFTKNQRQWKAAPLSADSIKLFKERCEQYGYTSKQILPHDSYLINLGHPEAAGLEKSREAFFDEMKRCEELGLDRLNFHPGSTCLLYTSRCV